MIAAIRRHLPGGRTAAVMAGFGHGWHAGWHDAHGDRCVDGASCDGARVIRDSDARRKQRQPVA